VTTAATLWLATVIGLCLGGGQIELGLAAAMLGLLALWGLKWLEGQLRQERYTRLSIELDASGPSEAEIRHKLERAGLSIVTRTIEFDTRRKHRELIFEVRDFRRSDDSEPPKICAELAQEAGLVKLRWGYT
jgi:putative Mg2+ transporter-C (MgtC) family protein